MLLLCHSKIRIWATIQRVLRIGLSDHRVQTCLQKIIYRLLKMIALTVSALKMKPKIRIRLLRHKPIPSKV